MTVDQIITTASQMDVAELRVDADDEVRVAHQMVVLERRTRPADNVHTLRLGERHRHIDDVADAQPVPFR